jgi:hypothetical protein
MDCLKCMELEQAFESRLSEYIGARSAAYYRVSTEVAARKNVDMERARNDLEEHRLVCVSGPKPTKTIPLPSSFFSTFSGVGRIDKQL